MYFKKTKVERNTHFSAKCFCDTASLRSAHGLYKPFAYNYEKTFFILVLTSNKTVSKNKDAENILSLHEDSFVHRPPPSAPGFARSFLSLFSLQTLL